MRTSGVHGSGHGAHRSCLGPQETVGADGASKRQECGEGVDRDKCVERVDRRLIGILLLAHVD